MVSKTARRKSVEGVSDQGRLKGGIRNYNTPERIEKTVSKKKEKWAQKRDNTV